MDSRQNKNIEIQTGAKPNPKRTCVNYNVCGCRGLQSARIYEKRKALPQALSPIRILLPDLNTIHRTSVRRQMLFAASWDKPLTRCVSFKIASTYTWVKTQPSTYFQRCKQIYQVMNSTHTRTRANTYTYGQAAHTRTRTSTSKCWRCPVGVVFLLPICTRACSRWLLQPARGEWS